MRKLKWARQPSNDQCDEKGVALVACLCAMLMLTALGLAVTTLGILGNTLSTNQKEMKEALFSRTRALPTPKRFFCLEGRWILIPICKRVTDLPVTVMS